MSCNCCYPLCPSPIVEIEIKNVVCTPINAYTQDGGPQSILGRIRDDGDGSDVYITPLPEACAPYKQVRRHVTGSYSRATSNSVNGEITNTEEISGSSEVIWTQNKHCDACNEDETATGTSDYLNVETSFGTVTDSNGDDQTYTSRTITITGSYGGLGAELPDHDPMADPPDPVGDHGDFIWSRVVVNRDPVFDNGEWTGSFTEETEERHEFRTLNLMMDYNVGFTFQQTQLYTNQPLLATHQVTNNNNSATRTLTEELIEQLDEEALFEDAEDCLDAQDWQAVNANNNDEPIAIKEVEYKDVVLYDNDPQTPEVAKTQTSAACFSLIRVRKGRVRFRIPDDFNPPPEPAEQKWHGSWHRIQYRLIFTPAAYDHQDINSHQPVILVDGDLEWEGPGQELETSDDWDNLTPEEQQEREDSWRTDWIDVDIPEDAGEITLEFNRSQCYHGAPWTYHD